jgi:ribonuclease G
VAHGPREILTKRCPTCHGDGIVLSETTTAVEAERKLRALAAESRSRAFRVELNAHVAEILIGPGAGRLEAIEERTRRRFFIVGKEGVPADHFKELERGPVAKLQPERPVEEGQERQVKLVEVGLHDQTVGVAKEGDFPISVAGAADMVGKRVKVRIERVLDDAAYAELVGGPAESALPPITAEAQAEKPTRARRSRAAKPKAEKAVVEEPVVEEPVVEEEPAEAVVAEEAPAEEAPKKKKTRRGSRGGRRRKKKPAVAIEASEDGQPEDGQVEATPVLIHVPDPALGSGEQDTANGEQPKRKKTRRGSRGGRRRKKPAPKADTAETAETAT